ncbi:MAG: hypothetical protein ABIN00_02110 [candidate division WOR-3 bacterium]
MFFLWTLFVFVQTIVVAKKNDPYKRKIYLFINILFSIFLLLNAFIITLKGFIFTGILLLLVFLLNLFIALYVQFFSFIFSD